MTDSERLWTGIALSVFLHFALTLAHGPEAEDRPVFKAVLEMESDSLYRPESVRTGTGVQQLSQQNPGEAEKIDRKRRAYLRYLDEVDGAIHARRLDGRDYIGVCLCAFTIGPDGTFSDISLVRSSGDKGLDAAALRAVHLASGVVKRPDIIGFDPIHVSLHVKYQHSLR